MWAVSRDSENVTEIQEDIEEVVETLEHDEDPHHVALAGHPGPRTDHRCQPRWVTRVQCALELWARKQGIKQSVTRLYLSRVTAAITGSSSAAQRLAWLHWV